MVQETITAPRSRSVRGSIGPLPEIAICALIAAVYFAVRIWGLAERPTNSYFDEGVHLALMKLLAEGQGALYRDYLFIHPPGVVYAGSVLWSYFGGELLSVRLVYIAFCSLALIPIYMIARRLFGVKVALGSALLIAVTPGFAGWQGRSIFLEQPLNVFVYCALAALVYGGSGLAARVISGMILGIAFLVKETAVVAGLAAVGALLASGRIFTDGPHRVEVGIRRHAGTAAFFLSFALCSTVIFLTLGSIPNYLTDTVTMNTRDAYGPRWKELEHGFYQLPIQMIFGTAGVALFLRRRRSREEVFLAAYALIAAALMLVLPKRFFWRHLMLSMPIFSIAACVYLGELYRADLVTAKRAIAAAGIALCCIINFVTMGLYFLSESRVPPEHRIALGVLREARGPVFTLDPCWTVAAQRELPRWRFAADAVFARQYDIATAAELKSVLLQCPTVTLNRKTLSLLPPDVVAEIRRSYDTLYRHGGVSDHDYVEILNRDRRIRGAPIGAKTTHAN